MPYNEHIANRVRRVLSRRRRVIEKRMMGALVFMVDGGMCCSVGRDGLLVRVAPDERDRVLARRHVTPMKMRGRTMTGFVRVAPPGFRTEAALRAWIQRGIATARAARKDRARPRARRRRTR